MKKKIHFYLISNIPCKYVLSMTIIKINCEQKCSNFVHNKKEVRVQWIRVKLDWDGRKKNWIAFCCSRLYN